MTEQERRNCEGLMYLTWDMFDSPDQPGSGYKFMEREPALVLDKARHMMQRKMFDIELAYTSPAYANRMNYSMNNSHRIGKAVLLRVKCPKKKWDLIKALMKLNVHRIAVQKNENHELIYFDTDDQKERGFFNWILKREINMYDLTEFYRARIEALSNQHAKDEKIIIQLATLIFELCDKDCPDEYKNVAIEEARRALGDD